VAAIRVAFEIGSKRAFASALDWPGWSRAGKGQEDALQALIDYAPRYAKVASKAGVPFPVRPRDFEGVEHLTGNATTDYGAPGIQAEIEGEPMTKGEVERMWSLVEACWSELDRVVKSAPAELRKGPRGGGRDRDKIVLHVLEDESGYAPKVGLKLPTPAIDDRKGIAANRSAMLEKFRAGADGKPLREGGWSGRYMARRIAWHALDHAWEIEDRSEP
jgi:hypothetical protein